MNSLTILAALSIAFVLVHVIPSHPPVRDGLVERLGRPAYLGLYSLVSSAVYLPMVWLWWTGLHQGTPLWALRSSGAVHGMELVVMLAVGLLTAGAVLPAPSSVGAVGRERYTVTGPVAITRHPALVGIATLSLGHMVLNGWPGDLWFWGSHFVLAILGMWHLDHRHGRTPAYADFMRKTTVLPNPLGLARLGGLGWGAFLVGLGAAFALRWAHRFIW